MNIIDKVQKLLKLSQSSNVNEATLAAAKAQELIDTHNLSAEMLAIEQGSSEPEEEIVDFSRKAAPLDEGKQADRWRGALALIVAQANACRCWMAHGGDVQIVGRPSDVETVRYLYSYLKREVERLADKEGRGAGKTWRNNFRLGVIDTLSRRMKEKKEHFRAEALNVPNDKALVLVNKALANIEKRSTDVNTFMKEKGPKLHDLKMSGRSDWNARRQGREAGKNIALNAAKGGLGAGRKGLLK